MGTWHRLDKDRGRLHRSNHLKNCCQRPVLQQGCPQNHTLKMMNENFIYFLYISDRLRTQKKILKTHQLRKTNLAAAAIFFKLPIIHLFST